MQAQKGICHSSTFLCGQIWVHCSTSSLYPPPPCYVPNRHHYTHLSIMTHNTYCDHKILFYYYVPLHPRMYRSTTVLYISTYTPNIHQISSFYEYVQLYPYECSQRSIFFILLYTNVPLLTNVPSCTNMLNDIYECTR